MNHILAHSYCIYSELSGTNLNEHNDVNFLSLFSNLAESVFVIEFQATDAHSSFDGFNRLYSIVLKAKQA